MEQSVARTASGLSHFRAFLSANLVTFIPTAIRAILGGQSSGRLVIESERPQTNASELRAIRSGKKSGEGRPIISGATASLIRKFLSFSKLNPSGVRFAKACCRKTIYASITATALAMFGVSFATSAIFGSPLLSGQNFSNLHWHTSKVIEASHKQACGNTCTGYDKIEITPKELLNSAVFNWSRVVSMFSLTGTELLYTRGEEEVIDLMAFYVRAAEKSVKQEWESALVGDGSGSGGRQMIGLGGAIPIIPNAGTYGGISRVDVANWRTSFFDIPNGDVSGYTTWDSTTARPIISKISLQRSRNGQYPDLWIFDANSWVAVEDSFVAHQRLASERLARLGFSGMAYHTAAGLVDLVAAGGVGNVMPANTAFGIDTSSLSIYEFPGQSFVPFHPGDGMRPINQDAVAQGIVWSGQLVLENPLFSVRIETV